MINDNRMIEQDNTICPWPLYEGYPILFFHLPYGFEVENSKVQELLWRLIAALFLPSKLCFSVGLEG
jgi:hypothetical protein